MNFEKIDTNGHNIVASFSAITSIPVTGEILTSFYISDTKFNVIVQDGAASFCPSKTNSNELAFHISLKNLLTNLDKHRENEILVITDLNLNLLHHISEVDNKLNSMIEDNLKDIHTYDNITFQRVSKSDNLYAIMLCESSRIITKKNPEINSDIDNYIEKLAN